MKFEYNFDKIMGIGLKIIGIGLFILSFISIILLIYSLNLSIAIDEYFTLYKVVTLPFDLMMTNILTDVHPPFYYFIVYGIFNLLNGLNISYNPIITAKIISIIPVFLLVIFSLFVLRKKYGWLFGGIFSFAIVTLPNLMHYATTIRMYSWGLLIVTLAFYYAWEITKKSTIKNWAILTILTILGAYTHYVAAIILFSIYLYLLIWILTNHKKQLKKNSIPKSLKRWIISCLISILSFIPWIFIVNQQLEFGNAEWIPLPTLDSFPELFWFLFSPTRYESKIAILLVLSFLVLILFYFFKERIFKENKGNKSNKSNNESNFNNSNKSINSNNFNLPNKVSKSNKSNKNPLKLNKKIKNYIIWGLFIILTSIILVYIVSYIGSSMWRNRYFVFFLGILWMVFTYLLCKSYSKKIIFVPIFIILLLSGVMATDQYVEFENDNSITNTEYNQLLDSIDKNNSTIITTSIYTFNIMERYDESDILRKNIHVYLRDKDAKRLIPENKKDDKDYPEDKILSQIKNGFKKENTVYLFTTKNKGAEFIKFLNKHGYKVKFIKNIHKTEDDFGYPTHIYEILPK